MSPTHCRNGHEYTPENTLFRKEGRNRKRIRRCRTCTRRGALDYYYDKLRPQIVRPSTLKRPRPLRIDEGSALVGSRRETDIAPRPCATARKTTFTINAALHNDCVKQSGDTK